MKIYRSTGRQAFTVFEGLVIGCILLLLLVVFLPLLAPRHHRTMVWCVNNLKEVGIAFRIWEGDNNDKYPMAVSVAQGGAQEMMATGNVAACFQVMSNELATPKILVCPEDSGHEAATDFNSNFTRANISYFIGVDAVESDPQAVMAGDANLVLNGHAVPPGVIYLRANAVTWSKSRHAGAGFVLIADGSVQAETKIGFTSAPGTLFATNRLAVP